MKTIKFIFLLLIALLHPLSSFAQKGSPYKIPSTGEMTIIVNAVERDFEGPKDKFLKPDPRYSDTKTFLNKDTKLTSLEEAMYKTNDVLNKIDEALAEISEPNESLALPLSISLTKYNSNLKQARIMADSLIHRESEMSENQLAALMVKFGNAPTYYINGQDVAAELANTLKSTEILSKEIKTIGTVSGNPNGEIWFEVTPNGIDRINSYTKQPLQNNKSLNTRDNGRTLSSRGTRANSNNNNYEEPAYYDNTRSDDDVPKRFRNPQTTRSSSGRTSARPRI